MCAFHDHYGGARDVGRDLHAQPKRQRLTLSRLELVQPDEKTVVDDQRAASRTVTETAIVRMFMYLLLRSVSAPDGYLARRP